MRAKHLQRGHGVAGLQRFQADFFERHGRALADSGIVIDHEHRRHHIAPVIGSDIARGSVIRNREPPLGTASMPASPPCHRAISATSESPSPRPCVPAAVRAANEALEDPLAIRLGDSGTAVFDFEDGVVAAARHASR